jgi:hypothetical protein
MNLEQTVPAMQCAFLNIAEKLGHSMMSVTMNTAINVIKLG